MVWCDGGMSKWNNRLKRKGTGRRIWDPSDLEKLEGSSENGAKG